MLVQNEMVNDFGTQSMTKVEKFGWSVLDEPGEQKYIDKRKLKIDPTYQRDRLRDKTILRMAANWSWVACGAILVADRDGIFYIIDGQQRVAASMKRSDISKLPVMVFRVIDVRDEAVGFLRVNTERKNVRMIDKLKAMLISGDPIANQIHEMAEDCGRTICNNSSGDSLKCVSTLYRNIKNSPDQVKAVWPLILRLCFKRSIPEIIVDAFVYIQKNGAESIVGTKWEKKILDIGYDNIIKHCYEAAAYYKKGGARVWSDGVINAMNKGMKNRFKLKIKESA